MALKGCLLVSMVILTVGVFNSSAAPQFPQRSFQTKQDESPQPVC